MSRTDSKTPSSDLAPWTRFIGSVLEPSGNDSAAELPSGEVPLDMLIQSALVPAAYMGLRRKGDSRAAPLKGIYQTYAARNVLLLDQAERVGRWLTEEGIRFVMLKGIPTIARFCKKDAGIRPMADADILVSPADHRRAVCMLESKGMVRVKPPHPVTELWASEVSLQTGNSGLTATIDLHRTFHNWPLLSSFSRWVLESREQVDGWWVPSVPASMLVIAAHRFRHAFVSDARELMDLAWLSRSADESDWQETVEAAENFDLVPSLYMVLCQAEAWFGAAESSHQIPSHEVESFGFRHDKHRYASRVHELRRKTGRLRSVLLDRLVPIGAGVTESSRLPGGFVGQYLSMIHATTRILPPAAAILLYASSRIADEIVTGGKSGFPWPFKD